MNAPREARDINPLDVAILVIGDEILDGYVEEANAAWLTDRLHELDIPLRRISVVRDDIAAIHGELRHILAGPRPLVVLTSGGIGGTWDDVTYAAVADLLGVDLVVAPALARPVQRIIDWCAEQGYQFDTDEVDGMMSIATVPAGSEILQVETFLACVHVPVDGGFDTPEGASIVVLPGPPGHLQALFDRVVAPQFLSERGAAQTTEVVEHDYPETLLVGAIARIHAAHPEVSIGSYPGSTMRIRFQGPAKPVGHAAASLRRYLAELDEHPAAETIRMAWKQQVADWSGDARRSGRVRRGKADK